MLTLYHNDMSTCSQKVRFVLETKTLAWESVELNLRAGDQQKPAFLKLNPKGVVPVLVDGDTVVTESNIIMEYLEDVFPESSLRPSGGANRAAVRAWMQKLDTGFHMHIATLSFAIAFRIQLLQIFDTDEKLEGYYQQIPDPEFAAFYRDIIPNGVDSPRFSKSLHAYNQLIEQMESDLTGREWLVGDNVSLADAAYAPYMTRLHHLQLGILWADRPNVRAWYERLRQTPGYTRGITQWFNDKYLPLMRDAGEAAAARVHMELSHG